MGLCCCKKSQTEDLTSQNEMLGQGEVLEAQNLLSFVMEDVPDAPEKEQLTEHSIKLSVQCEEDPEGLGGEVVFGYQSFPLLF